MAIKDLLEHLKYSGCGCPIDVKEDLGVVNGVCLRHPDSVLLVNGARVGIVLRELKKKKVDKKASKIV